MAAMPRGYEFYFDDDGDLLVFPITPGNLTISSGSRNETIDLINDGEINILKSPSLITIKFEARFPMREYPYSRVPEEFQNYFDKFAELKSEKKYFRFIVARSSGVTKSPYETNLLVSLEDFSTTEDADDGDDIICSFTLKQYKPYGVKQLGDDYAVKKPSRPTGNKGSDTVTYTVKAGDSLWLIAKNHYDDGNKYPLIYEANKAMLDERNNKYKQPKYTIYAGQVLVIPGATSGSGSGGSGGTGSGGSNNQSNSDNKTTTNTSKINVDVQIYGQNIYAGQVTIRYYFNGEQKSVTYRDVKPDRATMFKSDYGKEVEVRVYNLQGDNTKKLQYYVHKVSNEVGNWKRSNIKDDVPERGTVYKCTSCVNCGLTITWDVV